MLTEFSALNKASHLSKTHFIDEIVIVYKTEDGEYSCGVESNYLGDESKILQRYLNGKIVPT